MIRRAARFILEDVSRTGGELLALRRLIPPAILVVGRNLLVVFAAIVMLVEVWIAILLVFMMVHGLVEIRSWTGLPLAVVCGALLWPSTRLVEWTNRRIEDLKDWSPDDPEPPTRDPKAFLWDRDLDGPMDSDLRLSP